MQNIMRGIANAVWVTVGVAPWLVTEWSRETRAGQ
jgi:hypothetical protein